MGVLAPQPLARLQVNGVKRPLRTKRVNPSIDHNRSGTRSFIETEVISIRCRIAVTPHGTSRIGCEGLDHLTTFDPMKDDNASIRNDRSGKTGSDRPLPDTRRPLFKPPLSQRRSVIYAVAVRSEELRPILRRNRETDARGGQQHSE